MNSPACKRRLPFISGCAALHLALLSSVCSANDPVCLDKCERRGGPVFVVISPDGKWLAATMSEIIIVWDFATRKEVAKLETHPKHFHAIAFTPDSQCIIHADIVGRTCLWDGSAGWENATDREILGPVVGADGEQKNHGPSINAIAVSPDGYLVAIPRSRETLALVSIDSGKTVAELNAASVNSVQFADQGKLLMVTSGRPAGKDPTVQFWDMETFTAKEPLRAPCPRRITFGFTNTAVLSPTEEIVAQNITDGTLKGSEIRLFELPSRRWVTLTASSRLLFGLAFSPDGRLLAVPAHHTPSDPAAVLVWDLRARKWQRYDCPTKIAQQNIAFFSAQFSPDGRYLAAGLTHPEVAACIWDLEADEETSESD